MQLQTMAAYKPEVRPSEVKTGKQSQCGFEPDVDNLARSEICSEKRSRANDDNKQAASRYIDEARGTLESLNSATSTQEKKSGSDFIPICQDARRI